MDPILPEGSQVFIKKKESYIEGDNVAVIFNDNPDNITVRQLLYAYTTRNEESKIECLEPYNKNPWDNYKSIIYDPTSMHIIGVVYKAIVHFKQ